MGRRKLSIRAFVAVTFCLVPLHLPNIARAADPSDAERTEFFESRIRPVLVANCYECHSSASLEAKGGLRVDFRAGLLKGGESGPAIVPGKPDESVLIEAVRHESLEMPPDRRLAANVIADFEAWIRDGAFDPRDRAPTAKESAERTWKARLRERRKWWSLQPPVDVDPPTIEPAATNDDWSVEPVDRFVHARLTKVGLSPAEPAAPLTLLRRLSFVLTGLPPRPEQVESFPAKYVESPDAAVEELVDELLASPHFGERFARHWMDVVRYTDTYGYEWDIPAKGSHEYRDYLVRAFNTDVGFDQLIREELAGDLLPEPRISARDGLDESMIGPMFFHMGEHRHGSSLAFNGTHQEMIDNKIDAFSKAFLGMTVACARCHDHKLDAVSQADYYALAGMFMTPRWTARPIDSREKHKRQVAELKRLRREITTRLGKAWTSKRGPLDSADDLRDWATRNRETLQKSAPHSIGWPVRRLLEGGPNTTGADSWRKLADEWRREHAKRVKENERFVPLVDLSKPGLPKGFVADGAGMRHGHVGPATLRIGLEGEGVVAEFLDAGYHTNALSPKLPGALRLPAPETFERERITLKLAGGEWAGRRDVPQNAFLEEGPFFFDPKAPPTWMAVARRPLSNGVTRVLTEITTASLNSNFPPRTGVANAGGTRLPDEDEGFDKASWFSVTGIVGNDGGGGPPDRLDEFVALFEGDPADTTDAHWTRLRDWFVAVVDRWAEGKSLPHDARVLNWMLDSGLLSNVAPDAEVSALVARYREVERTIAMPRSVNGMDERGVRPVDYRLNVRGDVYRDGEAIPRGFLGVFSDAPAVTAEMGSGRLAVAEYLSSRDNPVTARVYVNRVWQWTFGTGLVATPNDFGRLGGRPSHPELLDWLALRFMEEDWSTKTLVRRLVLSRTFRQAGTRGSRAITVDPGNRLLSHYPTRRLEAEAIRDSLLTVSGALDPKLGGRPINPPRSVEDGAKRLFSGPLESHGRRSLYLEMSIMDPPKFLVGFNLPNVRLPTGRRDETNVPAQSLMMLNHPLVVRQAERWGETLVEDDSATPRERVRRMFVRALGRVPERHEVERWVDAATSFSESNDVMGDRAAWTALAHAMFNTKEFLYYR